MGPTANLLALAVLPYVLAAAGAQHALARGTQLRWGRATVALAALIAVLSTVGLAVPAVLHALERDADRLSDGQVWRLVTALTQQDGGAVGLIGNLAALLVMGSVAELLLGSRLAVGVFLFAGVLAQLPALAWQPVGAGNSVANLGLAGAVAVQLLLDRAAAWPVTAAVLTLLAGIVLTAVRDVHGPAVLIGAVCLLAAGARARRRSARPRPSPGA